MRKILLITILLFGLQVTKAGQTSVDDSIFYVNFLNSLNTKSDSLIMPRGITVNDSTVKAFNESYQAYYHYKRDEFKQANKVFQWQLISSKIIFVMVIGLVLISLYFAK